MNVSREGLFFGLLTELNLSNGKAYTRDTSTHRLKRGTRTVAPNLMRLPPHRRVGRKPVSVQRSLPDPTISGGFQQVSAAASKMRMSCHAQARKSTKAKRWRLVMTPSRLTLLFCSYKTMSIAYPILRAGAAENRLRCGIQRSSPFPCSDPKRTKGGHATASCEHAAHRPSFLSPFRHSRNWKPPPARTEGCMTCMYRITPTNPKEAP